MTARVALVTGSSTGIGAALCRELAGRGVRVFATARRIDALVPLAAAGIDTLALDVNDDAAIAAAMAHVEAAAGRLDLLVNNAGFSQVGAVVDLTRDDLRAQYETNVIAPVAVVRAALPLLRAAVAHEGHAVLANVGSIVGLFTTHFAGAYCSSKAAIHSLTDALRMELAPFGIRVVSVQPGGVRSAFGDAAQARIRLPGDSLFGGVAEGIRNRAQAGQQGAMPAEIFVVPVVDALLAAHPPAVVRAGTNSTRLPLLKALLPRARFDAMLSKRFGLTRLEP